MTSRRWSILIGLLIIPEVTLFILIADWFRSRRRARKTPSRCVKP